jgi:hypothetical protein
MQPVVSQTSDGLVFPLIAEVVTLEELNESEGEHANQITLIVATGNYPFVPTDMDGQVRSGLFDIGSDEVSNAAVVIKPVTPNDVGPGDLQVLGIKTDSKDVVLSNFGLEQNVPNPSNPSTTIGYGIPFTSNVHLAIFDCLGREVDVLVNKTQTRGKYQIEWNAARFPSGIYFCRLLT